jgi:hypothetical protein
LNDSNSTRYSSLQAICLERGSNICLMLPNSKRHSRGNWFLDFVQTNGSAQRIHLKNSCIRVPLSPKPSLEHYIDPSKQSPLILSCMKRSMYGLTCRNRLIYRKKEFFTRNSLKSRALSIDQPWDSIWDPSYSFPYNFRRLGECNVS